MGMSMVCIGGSARNRALIARREIPDGHYLKGTPVDERPFEVREEEAVKQFARKWRKELKNPLPRMRSAMKGGLD